MSKALEQKQFSRFASEVERRAEKYPKKHGNWASVKLSNGRFLAMDTWNRSISMVRGDPTEPTYWNGFAGERLARIGIDFGRCEVRDPGTMRDVARELGINLED